MDKRYFLIAIREGVPHYKYYEDEYNHVRYLRLSEIRELGSYYSRSEILNLFNEDKHYTVITDTVGINKILMAEELLK